MKIIIKRMIMFVVWLIFIMQRLVKGEETTLPKKILVIYLTGIGDVVCLTPFLEKIKNKFSDAEIWGCFPKKVVELQSSFIQLDNYVKFDNYFQTIKEIRENRFDLIVVPGWALKHTIITLFSNSKNSIGFFNDHSFSNHYLITYKLEAIGMQIDETYLKIDNCHLSERGNPILEFFSIDKVKQDTIICDNNNVKKKHIVIHATADYEGRRWGIQNFVELVHLVETDLINIEKIFFVGSKGDFGLIGEIVNKCSSIVANASGEYSLLELKELIENSTLFIGNDSGPMHIASFSGTPTIGLMGPNHPKISGPVGRNSSSVYHELECSPCDQRICDLNYECIKRISVEEVFDRAQRICNDDNA